MDNMVVVMLLPYTTQPLWKGEGVDIITDASGWEVTNKSSQNTNNKKIEGASKNIISF